MEDDVLSTPSAEPESVQAPHVDTFQHAPLMLLDVAVPDDAWQSPQERLVFAHSITTLVDDAAAAHGLLRIKATEQGTRCMFTASPGVPPAQQAGAMLNTAQELLAVISKVRSPRGTPLQPRLTLHAGMYAGGIIGKDSWSYDLYGADVSCLLDMARQPSSSSSGIHASAAALELLTSGGADVSSNWRAVPASCVHMHDPHSPMRMYSLVWEASGSDASAGDAPWGAETHPAGDGGSATGPSSAALPQPPPTWTQQRRLVVKRLQSLAASLLLVQPHPQPVGAPQPARSSHLAFAAPGLEARYLAHSNQQRTDVDVLIASFLLLAAGGAAWALPASGHGRLAQLLLSHGWCLAVPALAVAWLLGHRGSYLRLREAVWLAHRVLIVAAMLLLPCGALADVRCASRLGTGVLVHALGFKVRFWCECMNALATGSALVIRLAHARLWCDAAPSAAGAVLCLVQAVLAPCAIMYVYERAHRAEFLGSTGDSAATASELRALKKLD